ncbi:hypothetical protein [Francisella sp. 19X1-34]|uniref:hypothetical protein n=1 Tax=Francisella sp. 19X1-34 TaxID=3087177 RepID=UPI002E343386|nr:hypothetical protein [Francisella sp. 19X1-34]MED7788102.1 hypothetical protein [Francisella sp. 19X1-34]
MSEINRLVFNEGGMFHLESNSLVNAQPDSHNITDSRLLLGSSFSISIAGQPVTLTKFKAMQPGGASEPRSDIVATLERMDIENATLGTLANNSITIGVTSETLNAIQTAYASAAARNSLITTQLTITPDSLIPEGQFYFISATGKEGIWESIARLETSVTFTTIARAEISPMDDGEGPNAPGYVTFDNVLASNNFKVSISTSKIKPSDKLVVIVRANNSAAAEE